MAFSFGASSTPSFSFGGGGSAPSLFGGASTGAVSLFGAATTQAPAFSGPQSTPAFSFSTGAGLFGAPGSSPAFGVSPATATPSLFGGQTQAGASVSNISSANQQLVTKDNRPITHSTKWEELSPQAQQYLLELEKVITTSREECLQLDGEERLKNIRNISHAKHNDFQEKARLLSQNLATLGVRVVSDREEAEGVRRAVSKLLRHTETAVYTYKKTHAWREAARTAPGQPLPSHLIEQLGGPVDLPSPFLLETVASFRESIATQEKTAAELEANLQVTDKIDFGGGVPTDAADPFALMSSLQASIANIYDCLMRAASRLQYLDDKIASLKTAKLVELQRSGSFHDPFLEAEQRAKHHATALITGAQPKVLTPSEPAPIKQSVATPGKLQLLSCFDQLFFPGGN